MRGRKHFCEDCGNRILKRQIPWCDSCRGKRLEMAKGRAKTKSKNNMNFKLQDEEKPAEAGIEEKETPEKETPEEETKEEETKE